MDVMNMKLEQYEDVKSQLNENKMLQHMSRERTQSVVKTVISCILSHRNSKNSENVVKSNEKYVIRCFFLSSIISERGYKLKGREFKRSLHIHKTRTD
jgi:hypothetical protein